jgi:acyl-CoA thioester hydrolase
MNGGRVFSISMQTRDCECDLQGIINNSVYLNYLEHTRHTFLRHLGLDFKTLHIEGVDAVVRRIEIDYKRSLRGMEQFVSNLEISTKGRLQECVPGMLQIV